MHHLLRVLSISILLAVVVTRPAEAQQQRVVELERRVAELERTVERLQQRIAALEARTSRVANPSPSRVATGNWRERGNWRQLRQGMTEDQVERLLGEADRVNVNEYFFTWYYGGYADGGQVQFDADTRRVESWREP